MRVFESGYASLYAADASVLADKALYEKAYASVSDERQKKADSFRFEKDRHLSLGAAVLLQAALKDHGISGDFPGFRFGENGKPYLAERDDAFFSISHSGNYVLCAVSGSEIGCDIEKTASADIRIAKRFFTPAEYETILNEKDESRRNDLFYRYWTLKESYIKATGAGLSKPLGSFTVGIGGSSISVIEKEEVEDYSLYEFNDIPGYRCAVCIKGRAAKPEFIMANLENCIKEMAK